MVIRHVLSLPPSLLHRSPRELIRCQSMQPNPALANDVETPDAMDASADAGTGTGAGTGADAGTGAGAASLTEHTPPSLSDQPGAGDGSAPGEDAPDEDAPDEDGPGPSGAGQAVTPGKKVCSTDSTRKCACLAVPMRSNPGTKVHGPLCRHVHAVRMRCCTSRRRGDRDLL